jgi:hypothetical protein
MARCSAFQADRIVIIGCAGGGEVNPGGVAGGAARRAPHVRRDDLGSEGSDQYRTAAAATVSANQWIFDDAPYYVEDLVYRRAGRVIGFDLPRFVVMQRVISRSQRESLSWTPAPPHCDRRWRAWLDTEHPSRWAWTTWADRHKVLAELRNSGLAAQATLVSLTTPTSVAACLARRSDPGWSVVA